MTYPQDNQANPHNQLKSELPSKMTTCATLTRKDSEAHQANGQLKTKLPPVPDLDNRRYCRACQCTLPLSAFPSGTRRFYANVIFGNAFSSPASGGRWPTIRTRGNYGRYGKNAGLTPRRSSNTIVFCCYSGIFRRHWRNWKIVATAARKLLAKGYYATR